jgi:hypothetical protein
MRSVVMTLWNNILDPQNDERLLDMISFFTLVFNGSISNDEVQEIMNMRGQEG